MFRVATRIQNGNPPERKPCCSAYSRSRDAVIRVYDEAGNVIETHEQIGGLKGDFVTRLGKRHALA
jgi:hypothetical protein